MALSVVEIACKQRDIDELEAKRNKLKQDLTQHRDIAILESGEKELRQITGEITTLKTEIEEAKRGRTIPDPTKVQEEIIRNMANLEKVNVRTAFAKHILFSSTGRTDCKLDDVEKRALGVATTTTSPNFSAPTAGADGINNGGIFIPEIVMLEILREEELESPIYRDIITTAITGKIQFPYRISKSGAKNKAENVATENESVKWGILSGVTGNYTDSIVLTFEEEAMSIEEFTDYLISLLGESMRELLIADYIYGTGTDNKLKGITVGAINATYVALDKAKHRANLEKGILALPIKKRAGAKIYLASDIFDGLTFEKDKNDNYILPVLNGGGLTRLSSFTIEMEPNLKVGEFIIGNIRKYYKANINKSMELGLDISNQRRIKTYTTHMMVTGIAVPDSIVHGYLSTI